MFKRFTQVVFAVGCLVLSTVAFASDVDDYRSSWEYRALQYQADIDRYVPLGKANFITTHNSYNAGVYSQNGSYIDPNQNLSIYNQLQIGIRALELDVHFVISTSGFWPWEWRISRELKLSHAQGPWGAHPNDRYFTQGLGEIRDWLNNNRNEVLLLYLEDHMENEYDRAISELNSVIGSYLYRPNGCQTLPMNLTKADVLAAGKQVLLIGGNCATSNWANYVYQNHFTSTEKLDEFSEYPTCTVGNKDTDYLQNNLVRIYEDRTNLTDVFDPGRWIYTEDALKMTGCGIGAIGLDKVDPADSRLSAQIWSWSANEPNNWGGGQDCVIQWPSGRFDDTSCGNQYVVACRDLSDHSWELTSNTYTFDQASVACQDEFPSRNMVFSIPVNGYENAKLLSLKESQGINSAWLNYSDQLVEGVWVANPFDNLALGKSTSQSSNYQGNYLASLAVDGNPNSSFSGGTVTHTNNDYRAWWQVDLGKSAAIKKIVVTNRMDCCSDRLSNFYVMVSDQPMGDRSLDDLVADPAVSKIYQSGASGSQFTANLLATGRYVKVQLTGSNYLSLAEVEVYNY